MNTNAHNGRHYYRNTSEQISRIYINGSIAFAKNGWQCSWWWSIHIHCYERILPPHSIHSHILAHSMEHKREKVSLIQLKYNRLAFMLPFRLPVVRCGSGGVPWRWWLWFYFICTKASKSSYLFLFLFSLLYVKLDKGRLSSSTSLFRELLRCWMCDSFSAEKV